MSEPVPSANRYAQLIEAVFFSHYEPGSRTVDFFRHELEEAATRLRITLPKNLGDLIYSFRYRVSLPESIRQTEPRGETWTIRGTGRSSYQFALQAESFLLIDPHLVQTKIPDATPGLIALYALSDEQALLAKLRYNRMLDIFTGITCYSLQNHLRTQVSGIGQTETDEIYVGVDKSGAHYVIPVQAKGGKDKLGFVQIENDASMCRQRFPNLECRPVAAQFIDASSIALMAFHVGNTGSVKKLVERHYRLVPPEEITTGDLKSYRAELPES